MGKRMPITIAGRHFETRQDARNHLRAMLYRWKPEPVVKSPDHEFLLALFAAHPSSADKAPDGVDHFEVRPIVGNGYTSACFFAVQPDGTAVDFSFDKALKGAYERQAVA